MKTDHRTENKGRPSIKGNKSWQNSKKGDRVLLRNWNVPATVVGVGTTMYTIVVDGYDSSNSVYEEQLELLEVNNV